jgi:hypothetical protein
MSNEYRELLLGCGRARDKRVLAPGSDIHWKGLTTLDSNSTVGADVVLNLEHHTLVGKFGLDAFDEVHAYEVLEHLGQQGQAESFFHTFEDIWQVLKPDGFLCATVPSRYSPWLWGDPGHTRAILPESLIFLSQSAYAQCEGERPTAMSDYRLMYHGDFVTVRSSDDRVFHRFILQAKKPARTSEPQWP